MTQTFTPDGGPDTAERTIEFDIPGEYDYFELCSSLPRHYDEEHEKCPRNGADAVVDDLTPNGDGTQTVTVKLQEKTHGGYDEPDEDDYDGIASWVVGFLGWVADEEPDLPGVQL